MVGVQEEERRTFRETVASLSGVASKSSFWRKHSYFQKQTGQIPHTKSRKNNLAMGEDGAKLVARTIVRGDAEGVDEVSLDDPSNLTSYVDKLKDFREVVLGRIREAIDKEDEDEEDEEEEEEEEEE